MYVIVFGFFLQAMPWPGISLGLNCLLLAATVGPPGILADGYVGKSTFNHNIIFRNDGKNKMEKSIYRFSVCINKTNTLKIKPFQSLIILSIQYKNNGTCI